MALTKVSGGILDPGINVAGIVTATGFDGPFVGGIGDHIIAGIVTATALDINGNADISGSLTVGSGGLDLNGSGDISGDLVIHGNLTANGDFTTLNTTLREVELLKVDADSSTTAGIITQRSTGNILDLYDGSNKEFSVVDGGTVYVSQSMAFQQSDRATTAGLLGRGSLLLAGTQQTDFAIRSAPHNSNLVLGVGVTERLRITSTGAKISGNLELSSTYPSLTWTDTNHNSDFRITNDDGKLIVYDITRGAHVLDFRANGDLHVRGDKAIYFGESNDLMVGHDGSSTRIEDSYGYLNIKSNALDLRSYTGSELYANFTVNGSAKLYYDGTERFATSGIGVTVTGKVVATGEVETAQDYPDFKPALDLNFSLTKKLDPRITFTRNGMASFVDENGDLKYSRNAPRFNHDPITKECKGLLMEKSKANLLIYSNQMTLGNATLEYNTSDVVAPDGTNTAIKMSISGSGYKYAFPYGNSGTDSNRVGRRLSYWVKKGSHDEINLTNNNMLKFTFSTKSITNDGTYNTYREKVEEYPNDWYRVSYTIPQAEANSTLIGKVGGSDGDVVAYFWGFQLEEDGYETSYIPTNGASVTRAAESAVIDGEEFNEFFSHNGVEFNDCRGTLISFSESESYANLVASRYNKVQLELNNDNKVSLAIVGASSPYVQGMISYGTATQIEGTSSGGIVPTILKHGIAFAKNSGAYTYNGNTVQTDNSMNVASSTTKYTQLTIGGQPSKTHLKRIIYYTNRISNTQLRNLTS